MLLSDKEIKTLDTLTLQYNTDTLPNLYDTASLKVAFVLLKQYFILLQEPVLSLSVVRQLNFCIASSSGEDEGTSFMNVMRQLTSRESALFRKMAHFMQKITRILDLSVHEERSLYQCFLNAMAQSTMFTKDQTMKLFDAHCRNMGCTGADQSPRTYLEYPIVQFVGEYIVMVMRDAVCPLYTMSSREMPPVPIDRDVMGSRDPYGTKKYIRGTLYITNIRCIFVMEGINTSSDVTRSYLEKVGWCWVHAIDGIITEMVDEGGNYLMVRLSSMEPKLITYFVKATDGEETGEKIKRTIGSIQSVQPILQYVDLSYIGD